MPPNRLSAIVDVTYLERLVKKDDLSIVDYIVWADTFRPMISYVINQQSQFTEALKNNISSVANEKMDINSI
jgi:hypothetical protein